MGNSGSSPRRLDEANESFRNRITAQLQEISQLIRNGMIGNPTNATETVSSGNETSEANNNRSSESRTPLTRTRYMLRRTSARLRRSVGAPGEGVESSRNSAPPLEGEESQSVETRRRARRPSFDEDAEGGSARRPRLLSEMIGEMVGEGEEAVQDDASFYFFFPLLQTTPSAEEFSPVPNVFTNPVNPQPTPQPTPQSAPQSTPQSTPQTTRQASPSPSPQVFVRVSQRQGEDNLPALQWTLYFLMPQVGGEVVDASSLSVDPQTVLRQAFAAFNNLMVNDDLTYEQLIRIQEMMGTVNRGVTTEMIDAKIAKFAFKNAQSSSVAGVASGTSCSVCLQDFILDDSLRTLPCAHSYHSECIDKWLNQVNKCPLCRQEPVNKDESSGEA